MAVLESPPMDLSDESLAASARAGDRAAFNALMARYRGLAFAYARARLGSREEAEDALQECFVRAYLALDRYRGVRPWAAWFMAIVRNYCTDLSRKKRLRVTEPLPEWDVDRAPGPEHSLLAEFERDRLRAAIEGLPEKFRTPLLMHYEAGQSYREIAVALDLRETTLVGRLSGALRMLRRKLGIEMTR
jgi:RNA polymerase sigma-70 factor (ECF subfamily)